MPDRIALGAAAIGGFAVGSLAVGAVAIGALAIGRMAIGRVVIGRAEFKELRVGRLDVQEIASAGERPPLEPSAAAPAR
ncbi:MAG: hypothetical protein QJR09_00445 [Micrococcus sp.]|nr:hypothetical protein [Micrococcus sp.]